MFRPALPRVLSHPQNEQVGNEGFLWYARPGNCKCANSLDNKEPSNWSSGKMYGCILSGEHLHAFDSTTPGGAIYPTRLEQGIAVGDRKDLEQASPSHLSLRKVRIAKKSQMPVLFEERRPENERSVRKL